MRTGDLSIDARILRELGEIKATQGHIQTDIMDIKTEIRDIKQAYEQIEERVRILETVQAECKGRTTVAVSAFNKASAAISCIVSAVVALAVALITSGRL